MNAAEARKRICLERAKFWMELANVENKPSRLVADWKAVLKRAHSIKLAAAAPFVITAVWEVLSIAPPELRVFIGLPIWIALSGAAILARIWNQDRAA